MNLKDCGDALYRNGDHPKALEAYLAALLQEQKAALAVVAAGVSTRITTDEKTINNIQLARQQQRILSNIVATRLCMKQYKEALADANRCVACDPTWLKSYVRLAEVHVGMRQDGLALDVLKTKILEQDPDNVTANRMVDELMAKRQREKDAKDKIRKGTNESRRIWWLALSLVAMSVILPHTYYRYHSTKEPIDKDYYKVLGVHKMSSIQDIKSAYRDLAMKFHPDKINNARGLNAKETEKAFVEINLAYTVLASATRKPIYDDCGVAGLEALDRGICTCSNCCDMVRRIEQQESIRFEQHKERHRHYYR